MFSLCFSPNGDYMAATSEINNIEIWNMHGQLKIHDIQNHSEIVTNIVNINI